VLELNLRRRWSSAAPRPWQCLFGHGRNCSIKIVFNVFGMMANAIACRTSPITVCRECSRARCAAGYHALIFLCEHVPVAMVISLTEGKPRTRSGRLHFWSFLLHGRPAWFLRGVRQQTGGWQTRFWCCRSSTGYIARIILSRQAGGRKKTGRDRKRERRKVALLHLLPLSPLRLH